MCVKFNLEKKTPFLNSQTTNGPLLDFFLLEEVLYRFHLWSLKSVEHVDDLKFDQLKIYEELLTTG